jgi:hypothetical protein
MRRYLKYILEEVTALAQAKYPNDADKQHQYILGFLAGQLAVTIKDDSEYFDRFKRAIARQSNQRKS